MLLPYIIAGLVSGAVYGLAGAGLVLTYKTSGVFNFAHGAMATVGAYGFYLLHVQHGVPWPLAALFVLVAGASIGGYLLAGLAKALSRTGLALKVAATVGVLLIVQAGVELTAGGEAKQVPSYLPVRTMNIAGTAVSYEKLIVFAVALVATMGLWVFFRTARLGLAMRAVVDDPHLLDLSGTNPRRVRRAAWTVGVGFAMLSGLLLAPSVPLNGSTLTLLVVQAFGAAALGAFSSLPLTFFGGLAIGVGGSIATKYWSGGVLAQVPSSLPFVVLFIALLVFPRRWLQTRLVDPLDRRIAWTFPGPVQGVFGIAVVVVLALVPQFAEFRLSAWTLALTNMIIFVSLGLLVRTSGQVSLCHLGFAAVGASTFHHLAVGQAWPWLLALVAAGLVATPIGAILAIPAARLGGLYLALATLGFGIALAQMFYTSKFMFGEIGFGLDMPRPTWMGLDSDQNFYYLVLGITVVVTVLVVMLERGRLGRLLRGMSESSVAVATSGASVSVTRVLVFCLSAFMAAIAGALAGMSQYVTTADNYPPLLSLTYLSFVLIMLGGMPWYAVQAALVFTLVPAYVGGENVTNYLTLAAGVGAILLALAPLPAVPAVVRAAFDSLRGGRRRRSAVVAPDRQLRRRAEAITLDVQGVGVRFGGLAAVDGADLLARTGRITGLIGPNGAGKTTIFNAISGLLVPSTGRILVGTRDVTRTSAAARARLGLGRTFQVMELLDGASVRANVALGAEARLAGRNPVQHLLPRPHDAAQVDAATEEALELCGIADLADVPTGDLSTGHRRLTELARCLAGGHDLFLLDEPSSGLDRIETAHFGEILVTVVRERGVGILLVEHDMALVSEICDDLYVLDFGKMIASGSTAEVLASPAVQAAYLGSEAVVASADPVDPEREEAAR